MGIRAQVIINPRARRVRSSRNFTAVLQKHCQQEGLAATIVPQAFADLSAEQPASRRYDILVAVGGDGTISTVASECLRQKIPLGVIPAGTHNHFARDLGIPTDVAAAVRTIAEAHVTRVDVAEVNGHTFINNSSVGAYPRAVAERDRLMEAYSFRKWFAQLVATLHVFAQRPLVEARVEVDGKPELYQTPFIFVGNNQYEVNAFRERFRARLDGGQLCLFTSPHTGLSGFLRLVCRSLRGGLNGTADLQSRICKTANISLAKRIVRVSLDGEVLQLTTPLRYRIREQALHVIVPNHALPGAHL